MFLTESRASVERPILALCLAFLACVSLAFSARSWTELATAHPDNPFVLAAAVGMPEAHPDGRDVWIVSPDQCAACARLHREDAEVLRAAGARVRFVQLEERDSGALLRLIGAAADASDRGAEAQLERAMRDSGVALGRPYLVWRGEDGLWRAASGVRAQTARQLAAELQARA
ncbi:MAG: hypothetical protein GC189_06905 [Alphaproteobacteria bacterium]|nr:hypothetical protein [Alphaproteobacteria bacterium]